VAVAKLVPVRRSGGMRSVACRGRDEYHWENLGCQFIRKVEEQSEDANNRSRHWRSTRVCWVVIYLPGASDGVPVPSSAV